MEVVVVDRWRSLVRVFGFFVLASTVSGLGAPPCRAADHSSRPDRAVSAPHNTAGTKAAATGALSGKRVFISAGHGYIDYPTVEWKTQRGNNFGLVEDFIHAEAVDQYLIRYLRNAGADVVTLREADLTADMVIVDDGDGTASPDNGTYVESGDVALFAPSGQAGFANFQAPYGSTTDPFRDTGGSARIINVAATEGASATWTPNLPARGFYSVYVSYPGDSTNRAADAHYVVSHTGGQTHIRVDQERDGWTWVFLGRFHFNAGLDSVSGSVSLVNDSSDTAGDTVAADAVRFGGGMGDVLGENSGTVSGRPRWEEGARTFTQFMGAPIDVYSGGDVTARSKFAAWAHQPGDDSVYFSWHSNAASGTSRGTASYVYSSNPPDGSYDPTQSASGSAELMNAVHDEIINDIRNAWDPTWTDRGYASAYFGELNPTYNGVMPSAMTLVAFHDNASDAAHLANPRFRQLLARAIYQGIVKYFANRDAVTPQLLPEPPREVEAHAGGAGTILVNWEPPLTDAHGVLGDAADSYAVYTSLDGYGFDGGTPTMDTSLIISGLDPNSIHFVRVAARNTGGESLPSETLAVRTLAPGAARALLVNDFDRLDQDQLVAESVPTLGVVERMILERMNTFNYVVQHAEALRGLPVAFDSTSNEAVISGRVTLAPSLHGAVFWATGEDSIADETLSDEEQQLLETYLASGGDLFLSGAEIGWDLVQNGAASDQDFYQDVLMSSYVADDSGVYEASGVTGSIFEGIGSIQFDDGSHDTYDVSYPDAITALPGATDCMTYAGTAFGACVELEVGGSKVVYLGFPFETIISAAHREGVMAGVFEFMDLDSKDVIFYDEFEVGDLSRWSSQGP